MNAPLKGDRIKVSMLGTNRSFEVTVTGEERCEKCQSSVIRARTANGKHLDLNASPDRVSGLYVIHSSEAREWRQR